MNKIAEIYILVDPRTNSPFYVGSTVEGTHFRLANHIFDAKRNFNTVRTNEHTRLKRKLILDIINSGHNVIIIVLMTVQISEAVFFEKHFYELLTHGGITLLQQRGITR